MDFVAMLCFFATPPTGILRQNCVFAALPTRILRIFCVFLLRYPQGFCGNFVLFCDTTHKDFAAILCFFETLPTRIWCLFVLFLLHYPQGFCSYFVFFATLPTRILQQYCVFCHAAHKDFVAILCLLATLPTGILWQSWGGRSELPDHKYSPPSRGGPRPPAPPARQFLAQARREVGFLGTKNSDFFCTRGPAKKKRFRQNFERKTRFSGPRFAWTPVF